MIDATWFLWSREFLTYVSAATMNSAGKLVFYALVIGASAVMSTLFVIGGYTILASLVNL